MMALRALIGRAILWFTEPVMMEKLAATIELDNAKHELFSVRDQVAAFNDPLSPESDWDITLRERDHEKAMFLAMRVSDSQSNQPPAV
jgi:hypothetical protein